MQLLFLIVTAGLVASALYTRKVFVRGVYSYLGDAEINHPVHGRLYPVVESVEVEDSPLWQEVIVQFSLIGERPLVREVPEPSSNAEVEEEETYGVHLRHGDSDGEEVLYLFTFTSNRSLAYNIRAFRRFVLESYSTPEEIWETGRMHLESIEEPRREEAV